jgi:hypothetical protein
MNAIGANQHVAAKARAVGKTGRDPVSILFESGKCDASADLLLWKDIAQHRIESSPRSTELGHRYFGIDAAITRENRASANRHSDIRVDMGAGTEKPFEHRRMNAEPRAAPGKPYLCPFDDDHVPTGAEEHARREQTAERSSDHDGATHVVTLSKKLVSA